MMASPTFEQAMQTFLHRRPFKPFLIELDDGEKWVVDKPEAVFHYLGGTAIYFRPDSSFDFVDCVSVKQLLELPTAAPA
jgi:hypothetical protein